VVRRSLATLVPFLLIACSSAEPERENIGRVGEALAAECSANVAGQGTLDVETVYLPDVVHCENGGAPLESLKAQAIASRTYLYYKLETSGSIGDGQGDQVYSCGSHAGPLEKQAVAETAGQVLRYSGTTIAAFYVAGATASPPACMDGSSSTSNYVTYNEGKTGAGITQTTLGFVSPSNTRNRGCMSQLGSRCLANEGKKADAIVKFYYGDDIAITQAIGPCVPTPPTKGDGGSDAAADTGTGTGASGNVDTPVDPGASSGSNASPSGGYLGSTPPRGDQDASGCDVARAPRTRGASLSLGMVALGALVVARRRRITPRSRS
jgi:hypothetical protein